MQLTVHKKDKENLQQIAQKIQTSAKVTREVAHDWTAKLLGYSDSDALNASYVPLRLLKPVNISEVLHIICVNAKRHNITKIRLNTAPITKLLTVTIRRK